MHVSYLGKIEHDTTPGRTPQFGLDSELSRGPLARAEEARYNTRTMRAKPAILLVTLLMAFSAILPAQTLTGKDDLQAYVERFLSRVVNGDIEAAFRVVRNGPRAIPTEEIDALRSDTERQIEQVRDRYGSIRSFRYLDRQVIDDLLTQYTYLTPMDRHVLRWRFVFFNDGQGWMLTLLEWDDRPEQLFNW
jgi:hypothetical protein